MKPVDYFELIERLMQFFTSGDFRHEAVMAKNEFFDLAGIFDENSQSFEMKMSQFLDWYLLSRRISKLNLTPIALQIEQRLIDVNEDEQMMFQNMLNHRHSLFECLKVNGNSITIRDALSGYKMTVKESHVIYGFDTGEMFEARIIPDGESFLFSNSFCFHPKEATKFIRDEIKKYLKLPKDTWADEREKLLVRLFRMRHKYDQYRHLPVGEIYTNESRIKS